MIDPVVWKSPLDLTPLISAVCVSIPGSEPCCQVRDSDILGKVLTVTRENMGANKAVKYPRVKLHCDQVRPCFVLCLVLCLVLSFVLRLVLCLVPWILYLGPCLGLCPVPDPFTLRLNFIFCLHFSCALSNTCCFCFPYLIQYLVYYIVLYFVLSSTFPCVCLVISVSLFIYHITIVKVVTKTYTTYDGGWHVLFCLLYGPQYKGTVKIIYIKGQQGVYNFPSLLCFEVDVDVK